MDNVIEGHWLPRVLNWTDRAGLHTQVVHDLHVFVDGVEIDPAQSQKLRNHSPDGFNIGYEGSGPAQCALGILLAITNDPEVSQRWYQIFKRDVLARLEQGVGFKFEMNVLQWIDDNRRLAGLTLEAKNDKDSLG